MEKIEKRTDYCGNITEKYIGQDVNLYGWVQRVRNLGNLFSSICVTVKAWFRSLLTKILVRS